MGRRPSELHVVELKHSAKLIQDVPPALGALDSPAHASLLHRELSVLEQDWKAEHEILAILRVIWHSIVFVEHSCISLVD